MKNKTLYQEGPTPTTIEKVKKGDYFRIVTYKGIGKVKETVYVADGYNRGTGKYSYYRFDDVNHFGEKKKGTPVVVGFDF